MTVPDGPDGPDEGFVPRARSDVAVAEVDGDLVLYDERSEELHVLNPTAGIVWAHCDGTASMGQMIDELSRTFAIDRRRLAGDVAAVVARLARLGLLEDVPTSPALSEDRAPTRSAPLPPRGDPPFATPPESP